MQHVYQYTLGVSKLQRYNNIKFTLLVPILKCYNKFHKKYLYHFLQQNVFAIHLESMTQRITEPVMSRMELAYVKIREYREPIVKNVQMDRMANIQLVNARVLNQRRVLWCCNNLCKETCNSVFHFIIYLIVQHLIKYLWNVIHIPLYYLKI